MKTPPDKLWQLLELAYADLKSVESDPAYKINMFVFHRPKEFTDLCTVCLAGSVMARTLQAPRSLFALPKDFEHWGDALRTISDIALGAYPYAEPAAVAEFVEQHYKPYNADPAAWHNYIVGLIQLLKELDV